MTSNKNNMMIVDCWQLVVEWVARWRPGVVPFCKLVTLAEVDVGIVLDAGNL
jgi:hypothetical protein